LGIAPYVEHILSSALVGYEKPRPEIFRMALDAAGGPAEAWMIGDSPTADYDGAEAAGISAILVHAEPGLRPRWATGLLDAAQMVVGSSPHL
jgi:putative hydrolase of the HAD superfamily